MSKDNSKKPFDSFFASSRNLPNGGGSWAAWNKPSEPERVYIQKDEWPAPKERTDKVFAKSCISSKWCRTDAGTTPEPTSNFGNVMVAGAMLIPSANTAIATALGADLALGRMAGGGIMQQGLSWALRGAGGPASIFILGMLPAKMGDGTLYTDNQLRNMTHAPTRVRFQFRRDAEGALQVYGIHTGASGDDTVRTVQATWNADKTAMETKLNDITILWTPRRSGLVQMPPLVYPDNNGGRLGTILVHPIPEGTDSQIEGLPGEDITTDDCILVFPADTGLNSLYLVLSKPAGGGDIKYHKPPLVLPAFPDTFPVKSKSSVQGGGGMRSRWKDRKGRMYEWDSQHGAVEMYDPQGKHLGEFNAETGEQTKPAKPGRTTPK
ncbi:S-type pyocin domain-containing protein [Pseudomonas sp. CCC2.2]|uniref:S-type pyocin domain-containing protein n=2 Tax=Pseudomonas TaxID=286 RepID=UPI002B23E67D|nr:S-type pyocin domain-containing protein [Pseudomonas sp. CCC2.2]MEB0147841.1 S-type pyocin domain-containing protein [Pseudomonas sp. CCC2.2]